MAGGWIAELERRQRTWLVTGAAGFIGSHIVQVLLAAGQQVIGLDNFSTGHRRNLKSVETAVGPIAFSLLEMVEGDIRNLDTCAELVARADFVLHQAALGSVPRSMVDPYTTHTVNVDGSMNLFIAALGSSAEKIVYASSSSVYGDDPNLPKVENRTGPPLSPYAAGKRAVELFAEALSRTHQLPAVGLRYFNVIGPRQDPEGPYAAVVPRWVSALRRNERPTIYGDGETSRDFCPVGNVVQANVLAAFSSASCDGQTYNVALGGSTTLNQLFVALRDEFARLGLTSPDLEPIYEDFRPGDIRNSLASTAKARDELGYAPSESVNEAIQRIVEASHPEG